MKFKVNKDPKLIAALLKTPCKKGHDPKYRKQYGDEKQIRCQKCISLREAKKRAEQKAKDPVGFKLYRRESMLKTNYGIDLKTYEKMYVRQNGLCAICDDVCFANLAVDHCHKTGKIRKLLCRACNSALGLFKDDPYLMRQAALYVEMFQE